MPGLCKILAFIHQSILQTNFTRPILQANFTGWVYKLYRVDTGCQSAQWGYALSRWTRLTGSSTSRHHAPLSSSSFNFSLFRVPLRDYCEFIAGSKPAGSLQAHYCYSIASILQSHYESIPDPLPASATTNQVPVQQTHTVIMADNHFDTKTVCFCSNAIWNQLTSRIFLKHSVWRFEGLKFACKFSWRDTCQNFRFLALSDP